MPTRYSFFALNLLRQATVRLTDAQLKTTPTDYQVLLPAPGTGLVLQLLHATVRFTKRAVYTNVTAKPYLRLVVGEEPVTNIADIYQDLAVADPNGLSSLVYFNAWGLADAAGGGQFTNVVQARTPPLSAVLNQPLQFDLGNAALGNLTGGHADNQVSVACLYTVYDSENDRFI